MLSAGMAVVGQEQSGAKISNLLLIFFHISFASPMAQSSKLFHGSKVTVLSAAGLFGVTIE